MKQYKGHIRSMPKFRAQVSPIKKKDYKNAEELKQMIKETREALDER